MNPGKFLNTTHLLQKKFSKKIKIIHILLTNAVTTRLNLKSYCDHIDGIINLPDHKRVVCQIESLHRITNNCKCNKKCKCPLSQYI